MDESAVDYEAFFSAFGDTEPEDGNQTDPERDTAAQEETAQADHENQETGEEEENKESSTDQENSAENQEKLEEAAPPQEEQKFTIKVNKETREVGLPEMTELAQKGADYDRIKGQLETSRTDNVALQKTIDDQAPIMEALELAAKGAGVEVADLVESIHVGILKGQGMTDAEAKAEIRAVRAEKAANDLRNKPKEELPAQEGDPNQDRAKREIAEFQAAFPDVRLDDETINRLAPDVQGGMTLTTAYLKMENARLTAALAEEQRKLEAEKQNQKNMQQAAPSQKDSGGGREKDAFDDFFTAFER